MRQSFVKEKISHLLAGSRVPLLHRLSHSLERDKAFPVYGLLAKAVIFYRSLLMSSLYLRKCTGVGQHARTRCRPIIDNRGTIEIGDNFNIISRNIKSEIICGPNGRISIGNDVFVNFGTLIKARQSVTIGNRVAIGNYSMISDTDLYDNSEGIDPEECSPIIIEDDVWLAARVIVTKGVVIGHGSVIAAGSVVSENIPPNVVAGGVPVRVIKEIAKDDRALSRPATYADMPESFVKRIKELFSETLKYCGEINTADSPFTISEWTASNHIRLIEVLESTFRITISEKEIIKLNTFGKICTTVYKHVQTAEQDSIASSISG